MNFNVVLGEDLEAQYSYPGANSHVPAITIPFDLEAAKLAFEPYGKKLAQVKAQADALQVQDDQSAQAATAIAGDVKRLSKSIDARRLELVKEPNDYVKSVNSMAKMFTGPAGDIERTLKGKLSAFQTQRELERRKEEERIRKAQEELYKKQQAEAKAAHVEPPPPPAPIPIKAETVTRSDTGASAHVRKVWKAEVLDERKVPREFCSPDMRLINQAVKGGIREIPGVKIWEDVQTILRT